MEVVELSGGNGGEWGGLLDKISLVIVFDSVFYVFLQEVSIGNSKGGIHVFGVSNQVNIHLGCKEDETLISND